MTATFEPSALEEALTCTGDGATILDRDGRITFWNTAAEELFGLTRAEALGRPCYEVFAGYDDNRNPLCSPDCHIMSMACRRQPVHSFDMRTHTKAGRPIWISVSVLGVDGARGPRVVHLFRDVTATKELVAMIHERRAPAPTAPTNGRLSTLSPREHEVLALLTEGLGNAAIAERLRVHRGTVRNHVRNIFGKLGVHSRLQAVAYASRFGR
jgi:PAS domain S-box-containing protein